MDVIAAILGILLAFASMWFAWYLLMPGQHDESHTGPHGE